MQEHIDRFSSVAGKYAEFRPVYPEELYTFLLSRVAVRDLAWDAGTGNGQVAHVLARHFRRVIGTDISTAQLGQAFEADNIQYRVASAEHSGISGSTVNLITVAQAVHWFDLNAFAEEVARVSTPGAMLAVWGYGLLRIRKDIDDVIDYLYADILDGYWDPQRTYLDRNYRDLNFPFDELPGHTFEMHHSRDVDALKGYLGTWSAVNAFIRREQTDPIQIIASALDQCMGHSVMLCRTPVFLRLWRVGQT